jgi:hypothetical protein
MVFNIFPWPPNLDWEVVVLEDYLYPRVVSHADFGHYPKAGYDYICFGNERQGILPGYFILDLSAALL